MIVHTAHKAVNYWAEDNLKGMIERWAGPDKVPQRVRIVMDTSDFFKVDYGDVLILEDIPYLIRNYEREGRFGIDDEPKYWVRRSIDLTDGRVKIIKMVFRERFTARCGVLQYECVRSPKKEERVLNLVKGMRHFMQGHTVNDMADNRIRVIDYIRGKKLSEHILDMGKDHEEYYYVHFPLILDEFIELAKAIRFLHEHGEMHGDIRRDHIIKTIEDGHCVWIDFDYECLHGENMFGYDIAGLGNVLICLAGRGDVTLHEMKMTSSAALSKITSDDTNMVFRYRVANLKKVYPYISDSLNFVLQHFSSGADIFYDEAGQMISDIEAARNTL